MTTTETHDANGGSHDKASERLALYLKVRVGPELRERLQRLAKSEGRSVANLVRRVLQVLVEGESSKEAGR